jgi:hypothetical protein
MTLMSKSINMAVSIIYKSIVHPAVAYTLPANVCINLTSRGPNVCDINLDACGENKLPLFEIPYITTVKDVLVLSSIRMPMLTKDNMSVGE